MAMVSPRRAGARTAAFIESLPPSLLVVAVVTYLGVEQGGFFPDATAAAAVVVAVALFLRTAFARQPFSGFGLPVAFVAGALGLYTALTLASAVWSGAPGRALHEFDRALLYLLVFLFFASYHRSSRRARGLVRALAFTATLLVLVAFVSRALPEVLAVAPTFNPSRLGFPLTYWNALGLIAVMGIVLCFSLTSDERESSPVRVLTAAAPPILAATLVLTFSRGAIAVGVVALLAYVVLAHNRGLVSGLLAVAPLTALAVLSAFEADLLATMDPTSPAAVVQGRELAREILLLSIVAAGVRAILILVDRRLVRIRFRRERRRAILAVGAGLLTFAAFAAAVAVDLPTYLERQSQEFARGSPVQAQNSPTRDRLASASSPARLEYWRVARASFREAPLIGRGAGTFETEWNQRRPSNRDALDAHSLYLEAAAELGLAGALLLSAALAAIVVALAWSARGRRRVPWVALLCCAGAWAARAAVDWDWEVPAVSLGIFAAGGVALASRRSRRDSRPLRVPSRGVRVLVCGGIAILTLIPASTWLAESRLGRAESAFDQGLCPDAIANAVSAARFVNANPEPFELMAYCNARLGSNRLAVRTMSVAAQRDPENWRYAYGLAVVRAIARLDPRGAAAEAVRLNPREERVRELARRLGETNDRRERERVARRAPVPSR